MVNLLFFLPLGFIIQAIGLTRAGVISKGRAAVITCGMLSLLAGDIEVITSIGALLMCIGYIPMGIRELQGKLTPTLPS